jgi:hypothetical protein
MLQLESAPKFPPGRVVITDHAAEELSREEVARALERHLRGDWGDLEAPNRRENERALLQGCRLLSAYSSRTGLRFWIITEPDRSATTILLPEDY